MVRVAVVLVLAIGASCGRVGFDALTTEEPLPDPEAEGPLAIDYGRRWAVLAQGRAMAELTPLSYGDVGGYSVSPTLPGGLRLDPETGVISGSPEAASVASYTISATGSLRSASFELVLDVRPAIDVDSMADSSDGNAGDGQCDTGTGECTLRAAIEEANQSSQPILVAVPAGTYPLAGEIQIRGQVAVVGAGTGQTVLDGQLSGGRLLKSIDTGVAHISDLDLRRGTGSGGSGLEVFDAEAHLSNVVVAQNVQAQDGGAGMKFTTNAIGSVEYSTISDNVGDGDGGGIAVVGGTVEVYRTRFVNNSASSRGGALSLFGSDTTVTVDGCYFEGNHADVVGGAMVSTYSATLTVRNTTFVGNTAITSGSVANTSFETPTIGMTHCTLVGADVVPAITGGADSITISNSIIATGTAAEPCGATSTISGGGNLAAMDATSCGMSTASGDRTELDPMLSSDESSPPAPGPSSPAVDSVSADQCGLTYDARGLPRPLDGNSDGTAACDVGAVEVLVLP